MIHAQSILSMHLAMRGCARNGDSAAHLGASRWLITNQRKLLTDDANKSAGARQKRTIVLPRASHCNFILANRIKIKWLTPQLVAYRCWYVSTQCSPRLVLPAPLCSFHSIVVEVVACKHTSPSCVTDEELCLHVLRGRILTTDPRKAAPP